MTDATRETMSTTTQQQTDAGDDAHRVHWRQRNYPLVRVSIELQGLKSDTPERLAFLLEEVAGRLKAGDLAGEMSDDDVGYRFSSTNAHESLFGDAPSTRR